MKLVKLAYPLPKSPTTATWLYILKLTNSHGLPAPPAKRVKGRWVLMLHPDDYLTALTYLQAFSLDQGLAPYNPAPLL